MGWDRDYAHEATMRQMFGDVWRGDPPQSYRMGALQAIVSRDDLGDGDLRWHISLSRKDRVPTWDELAKCAHHLRPGIVFCVPMPPRSWWLNVHPNCLHLHEIKDERLVDQWRAERKGHEQTAGARLT